MPGRRRKCSTSAPFPVVFWASVHSATGTLQDREFNPFSCKFGLFYDFKEEVWAHVEHRMVYFLPRKLGRKRFWAYERNHFLRTVVGKVVEHHSRCANCVAILIIPTFFLIYKYIKCYTSVALCSFCLRVTHTIFLYLLSLPHSPHLLTLLHSSFRCHFNLLSTFFSLTRPFILCSHLYSHSGFVLFCFLSFFLFSSSHTHTAGFSPHVHAHA